MNKNAIKRYAIWARNELIDRVSHRAAVYGITDEDHGDMNADSVNGSILTVTEKRQRQALIRKVNAQGYQIVMEEVAFTWFNRFAALRFMEVNGYLPSHVRVFTNDEGEFKPQMLTEAIHLELDGLDRKIVYALEKTNRGEDLFKYLLITQCNALNKILPGLFQKIDDYTELLLPDFLLREGSVIQQMVELIPEEDWTDQVQIIGWLYQYYNTEPKDKVFSRPSGQKINKQEIPAATQLFTPDWIVRYMVENSLGRLWLEGHPNDELKSGWKYYLDEAQQEPEVAAQLAEIRKEYAALKPEDIRVIDPCMGSGHILCYLFDVLVQIYEAYGYSVREAVRLIVEKNLYGLDLDERAGQLAYFAVMMKARQYDRRFFSRDVQPNIGHFQGFTPYRAEDFSDPALQSLVKAFEHADEYGSLLEISEKSLDIEAAANAVDAYTDDFLVGLDTREKLLRMVQLARMLSQKYDVVVTNPPYMGGSGMDDRLSNFLKKRYPDSKSDLFAVFIEKCGAMTKAGGYYAMITQHAWMFLSSYEKLRVKLQTVDTVNMAHLGARAFEEIGGEVVQTTAFVNVNRHTNQYKGTYCRLIEPTSQNGKEELFLSGENRYYTSKIHFSFVPECPVIYWFSKRAFEPYIKKTSVLGSLAAPCAGLATGDNNKFQRYWYEVSYNNIGFGISDVIETISRDEKWYPCNSGGNSRKWSTDNLLVVNWHHDGIEVKSFRNTAGKIAARPQNTAWYFKEGLTWNKLSTVRFAVKHKESGFIFDDTSRSAFPHEKDLLYFYIGLLCSCVTNFYLQSLNPTMSFTNGDLVRLPVILPTSHSSLPTINNLVEHNIALSRGDWDSFETSWDFKKHPLIRGVGSVEEAFAQWQAECSDRFHQLKANEEELNRIFIDIYGLQDELTPEVEDKDVTVRKADLQREIKSLISYAVGCMFGRYSLDVDGLVYAGGEFSEQWTVVSGQYYLKDKVPFSETDHCPLTTNHFSPDKDGILPITDDEYFEDDIVTLFVNFIETVYGHDTLEENLQFIANALTANSQRLTAKSPREIIRHYFINDFFADHCKIYQKRPIYWLFDSGKKNGFKCLIYLHRYRRDTVARVRTDYVHELQSRYRTAMADLEKRMASASTSDKVRLTKQLATMQGQADELRAYEEIIHHLADRMMEIDLDDGVKVNYAKFADVLAKIK